MLKALGCQPFESENAFKRFGFQHANLVHLYNEEACATQSAKVADFRRRKEEEDRRLAERAMRTRYENEVHRHQRHIGLEVMREAYIICVYISSGCFLRRKVTTLWRSIFGYIGRSLRPKVYVISTPR